VSLCEGAADRGLYLRLVLAGLRNEQRVFTEEECAVDHEQDAAVISRRSAAGTIPLIDITICWFYLVSACYITCH
jgi:hypothetical protein